MRTRLLVVLKIASQNPPQRPLVPHHDVIQALAPNRSDQSFHIGILPRRSRRRHHFFDPHVLREGDEFSSENRISIPDQIPWRFPWKRFSNLLRRPLFARMIRHVEVQHTAAIMRQDDENKQYPEGRSRHSEENHRGRWLHVLCQKGPPDLRRRTPASTQILAHRRRGDLDSELE